ncbi:hypothetical protein WOLCODRAFT_126185, partial [Wolfiporia cocos MD-104 SS10]
MQCMKRILTSHRTMSVSTSQKRGEERERVKRRERLQTIADDTLEAIDRGSYTLNGATVDLSVAILASKKGTQYYDPDSLLSGWAALRPQGSREVGDVSLLEVSTLEGARLLSAKLHAANPTSPPRKVGILNFASATKPGGGFKNGAQAQEESIARSSTLYPTLMMRVAQSFYKLHAHNPKGGYYSHAMIYSPGVAVFRDDDGAWIERLDVDVLTSAAVNAGSVRQGAADGADDTAIEDKIAKLMRERMARILFLFEKQGVRNVVLGSFGTGVFRNKIDLVAGIWADLLLDDGSRFQGSFDHVVFAILGRETYEEFERVFQQR